MHETLSVTSISIASSRNPDPHPEERRLRRVSKDVATAGAARYETAQGRLLTMRSNMYLVGCLS
jgi:hypothetical protein